MEPRVDADWPDSDTPRQLVADGNVVAGTPCHQPGLIPASYWAVNETIQYNDTAEWIEFFRQNKWKM